MDKWVEELQDMTIQMVEGLEEATYEDLERFVEKRGALIDRLSEFKASQSVKEQYAESVKRLLQYDAIILNRMSQLKEEADSSIVKINNANTQRSAYDAVYSSDSLFFDRRK